MKSLKIRECSEADITKVLIKIFVLVGLVNKPDKIETTVLIDFIKNDLKKYGLNEIELAFRMALKGELYERINGKDEQLNLNHYNNFSAVYISRVMNAYENKRRDAIKKENMKPVEEKQPTEQEKLSIVKQGIIENFELFKKTSEIKEGTAWQYSELYNMGLIKFTKERVYKIKTECVEPFREKMKVEKADSLNKFDVNRIVEIIANPYKSKRFENACRENGLRHYFKDLVDIDQEIKDLL